MNESTERFGCIQECTKYSATTGNVVKKSKLKRGNLGQNEKKQPQT